MVAFRSRPCLTVAMPPGTSSLHRSCMAARRSSSAGLSPGRRQKLHVKSALGARIQLDSNPNPNPNPRPAISDALHQIAEILLPLTIGALLRGGVTKCRPKIAACRQPWPQLLGVHPVVIGTTPCAPWRHGRRVILPGVAR